MAVPTDSTQHHCTVCGRPLRSARSIARGHGDRCAPDSGPAPHTPATGAPPSAPAIVSQPPPAPGTTIQRTPAAPSDAPTSVELRAPPRIITKYTAVQMPATSEDATTVTGIGYDSESRRLELRLDTGLILAYRNVGPDVHRALLVCAGAIDAPDWQRAQTYWTPERVRSRPAYQYRNLDEADSAGQRRRCAVCGQFTGGEHICRGRPDIASPWQLPAVIRDGDAQTLTVKSPSPDGAPMVVRSYPLHQVADDLAAAPYGLLEVPVRAIVPNDVNNSGLDNMSDLYKARLSGRLLVSLVDEQVSVDPTDLRCDCNPYHAHRDCRHLREVAGGMRAALSEQLPGRRDRWSTRLSAVVPDEPGAAVPADLSTFRYSDDPALFAQDVNAALSRDADAVVPFHDGSDGPVMYGFGSGRKFGVELEYTLHSYPSAWGDEPVDEHLGEAGWEEQETDEFGDYDEDVLKPDGAERTVSRYGWHTQTRTVLTFDGDSDPDMTKVVPARIAAAMYASDLTSDDTIGGHGDTGAYGYSNQPWGGWTLENDPTVHGEVISPILSDTLDSWRSLRMACRHITDHGGGASAETGSHVTVSAVDFVDSPDKVNRLIGVLRHYQRDLYLMGDAGHGRESRENQGYARPFTDPPPLGFLNVDEIQETRGRYSMVNLTHIPSDTEFRESADSARIEFRWWDGSMEPGRIQAQIKVSAALLDHVSAGGATNATNGDEDDDEPAHPNHDPEGFVRDTKKVRVLIDTLFHRDRDKQQAAALWAAGARDRYGWR